MEFQISAGFKRLDKHNWLTIKMGCRISKRKWVLLWARQLKSLETYLNQWKFKSYFLELWRIALLTHWSYLGVFDQLRMQNVLVSNKKNVRQT